MLIKIQLIVSFGRTHISNTSLFYELDTEGLKAREVTQREGSWHMWLHNCKVPCNYPVCMQADIKILFSVYDYTIRSSPVINITELWIPFMTNYLGAKQRTRIRHMASPRWSWKLKAPENRLPKSSRMFKHNDFPISSKVSKSKNTLGPLNSSKRLKASEHIWAFQFLQKVRSTTTHKDLPIIPGGSKYGTRIHKELPFIPGGLKHQNIQGSPKSSKRLETQETQGLPILSQAPTTRRNMDCYNSFKGLKATEGIQYPSKTLGSSVIKRTQSNYL
jgi:hypothetical protein